VYVREVGDKKVREKEKQKEREDRNESEAKSIKLRSLTKSNKVH